MLCRLVSGLGRAEAGYNNSNNNKPIFNKRQVFCKMNCARNGMLLLSTIAMLFLMSCASSPTSESGPGASSAKPLVPIEEMEKEAEMDVLYGTIAEPASMLWVKPGQRREYDRTMLDKPGDPAAWAAGMDTEMRLWLVGKVDTQLLYGESVVVLEQQGEWVKVAAVQQKSGRHELGYPGWLPAAHVATEPLYWRELAELPNLVVTSPLTKLYADQGLTQVITELCYQTRLPVLEQESMDSLAVRLPDGGIGYLPRKDVQLADTLSFSQDDIVAQAEKFLGLPYIWAGTSAYGFDCSGYTMRLYQSQGIAIPRDAEEQALEGQVVDKGELRPGDLLFFAAEEGRGQIHHVAMYIGNGMMIHSPNSKSAVQINAIDSGSYVTEYWGARRYAP